MTMKRTSRHSLAILSLVLTVSGGFGSSARGQDSPTPVFVNVAAQAGISWRNVYGTEDKKYIIEMTGTGAAFGDYDGDGDLDLYFVNGWNLDGFQGAEVPKSVLYRNDGKGKFVDVTDAAGVGRSGWGQGSFFVDYDNDGDQDLFLTFYGPDVLLRNEGGGKFSDVTAAAGLSDDGWSSGASFGDYDLDGDLDLYVPHYVDFELDRIPKPGESQYCKFMGLDVLCGPRGLPGQADRFFRNNGDGTFTEVTQEAGMVIAEPYFGFQSLFIDFDDDGLPDIFVANDSTPNFLWRNNGDGTFEDIALLAGVGYSEDGREQAGMGSTVTDFNEDGLMDLYVTNFSHDYNTLYMGESPGFFRDVSFLIKKNPTRPWLGWATKFFDVENDGDRDLFVSNGHIYPEVDEAEIGTTYKQQNRLFLNESGKELDLAMDAGPGFLEKHSSRGAVVGDIDNDGDLDIAVVNMNDVPSILLNETKNLGNWIGIKLEGKKNNREGIGSKVRVVAGGKSHTEYVMGGSGYLGTHDRRAHFGLGDAESVESLEIVWPGKKVQKFSNLPVNRYIIVREDDPSWYDFEIQ